MIGSTVARARLAAPAKKGTRGQAMRLRNERSIYRQENNRVLPRAVIKPPAVSWVSFCALQSGSQSTLSA
jgi:hypothetical protein